MKQSTGTCAFCGKRLGKGAMARHLKTCAPEGAKTGQSFHIFVEARYNKQYWLHLAVPVNAPLGMLDAFLRRIWLECCGHLSGFHIAGEDYYSEGMEETGGFTMKVRLNRLVAPGSVFSYEYDFGSTTELNLKVVDFWNWQTNGGDVELLARNDMPAIPCEVCGSRPAVEICSECDGKWLCESCVKTHDCDEEMLMDVVNSPRAGVCGYTG